VERERNEHDHRAAVWSFPAPGDGAMKEAEIGASVAALRSELRAVQEALLLIRR
jgi:hypothetical protein